MIFTKIKAYLYLGLGLLVAALAASTKYFSAKARKQKKRAKIAEQSLEHAIDVGVKDIETDNKFNSRRAEAKAEIKETGASSDLSDPNALWLRKGPDKD